MPSRGAALAFLALLAAPTAQAALVIGGFATDLPGSTNDDALEIRNDGSLPEPLDNVTVSDRSGTLALPTGLVLAPGQGVRLSTNSSAYLAAARVPPDLATDAADATKRVRVADPGFALAQDGDVVELRRADRLLDVVVYGRTEYAGPGWNGTPMPANDPFLRWSTRNLGHDSDTRADWDSPQRPFLGWRTPAAPRFHVPGEAVVYTAPDRSREMVVDTIRAAQSTLRINVYELRDVGLVADLIAHMQAHPELRLDLLVDSTPVGMSAEERLVRDRALADLHAAGARVRLLAHDRYPYDHAKYIIADDHRVLVQSENFVHGALPADARQGNRGWGVRIDDAALAQALAAVFDDDFALDPYGARDVDPEGGATTPLPTFVSATPRPRLDVAKTRGLNVTLVVGPESNLGSEDPLLGALRGAREEILVEQLALPPFWKDRAGNVWPNEYLNAVLEAARRGVRVRILMDGHFVDGSDDDNAATLRSLEDAARLLPVEARLMDGPGDPVLHVKGLVIDRELAWVGSMNWNLNSVAQNREVSLLLDAPVLAALFEDAFDSDWERARTPVPTSARVDAASTSATVITLAFLAFGMPRRRS